MRRKVFRNGQEEWEDLGPGVGRRHTRAPSPQYVSFMGEFVSPIEAQRELEQHVIPLVVAAREIAQQAGEFDIAA